MSIANLRIRVPGGAPAEHAPLAIAGPGTNPPAARKPEINHPFISIRRMLEGCRECNRNDQLIIAIKALIGAGFDSGPQIVDAATRLGFAEGHVRTIFGKSAGPSPARHHWRRGADGRYRVHEAEELAAAA